ncbi:MAG: flavin reductase family protein [Cryomorphaceae bacterium]|nr:flavin reductase family protein [Flavobacteriales bacterium]
MISISREEILGFEKRFRGTFVNSLSGVKSANLIATKSAAGNSNLAIFSSVIHLGASPPLLGFIMRPVTVDRHTYQNIKETLSFTVNHISYDFIKQAHGTSARYSKEVSEFDACGFTETHSEFYAPFVKESALRIACKLSEDIEIKSNNTRLITGHIEKVELKEAALLPDGYVDLSVLGTAGISALDGYHKIEKAKRFKYAKPHKKVVDLNGRNESES